MASPDTFLIFKTETKLYCLYPSGFSKAARRLEKLPGVPSEHQENGTDHCPIVCLFVCCLFLSLSACYMTTFGGGKILSGTSLAAGHVSVAACKSNY